MLLPTGCMVIVCLTPKFSLVLRGCCSTGRLKKELDEWAGGEDGWADWEDGWAGGEDGWAGGEDGWAGGEDGWAGGEDGWQESGILQRICVKVQPFT